MSVNLATRSAALLLCLGLSGCSAAVLGVVGIGSGDASVERRQDLVYAPEHDLRLDTYRPTDARGPTPLVVFLYGGSWQRGSRREYAFVGNALAAAGVAAVLPDYRTYPDVQFPAFAFDAAAAVAWAKRHAEELGADPHRVFVMGHSAGAHIAALVATDPRFLSAQGLKPGDLAGVIGLAGPYDVQPQGYSKLEGVFGSSERWPAARPVNHATAGDPPFLLLHGADDRTVPLRHSEHMREALQRASIPFRLTAYPDVGHVGVLLAIRYPRIAPVLDDTLRFVREPG